MSENRLAFASRGREFLGLAFLLVIASVMFSAIALAKRSSWDYFDLLVPLILAVFFLVAHLAVRLEAPRADFTFILVPCFLAVVGISLITTLDESRGGSQLLWLAAGLAAAIVTMVALSNYQWVAGYKYTVGLIGLVFLLAPMFLGEMRGGAKLWLSFGGYSLQPSEIAKPLLVLFFAAYLQEKREMLAAKTAGPFGTLLPEPRHIGPLAVVWLLSLAILIFERDLGSSMLFFGLFLAMLYAATGRGGFVFLGLSLFLLGAFGAYYLFDHVRERVDLWLSPLPADVGGGIYQLAQSIFVMAASGIGGSGLGQGVLGSKIAMPAVTTDFIFTASAEQLGLAGSVLILLAYVFLLYRGVRTALVIDDDFAKLAAFGLSAALTFQALVIVAGVAKLIPLTGVTLPFVSYGGSSMVGSFIAAGALLAISNKAYAEERG